MDHEMQEKELTETENLSNYFTDEQYGMVLQSIAKDMDELQEMLPIYAKDDLEMFRIKVHGIKGVTRQVGLMSFSNFADQMQLAAKKGDASYIEENLTEFLQEMQNTRAGLEEKIQSLAKTENLMTDSKGELWHKLKAAFEEYDYAGAEEVLLALSVSELDSLEQDILGKCQDALNEMDYEIGALMAGQIY